MKVRGTVRIPVLLLAVLAQSCVMRPILTTLRVVSPPEEQAEVVRLLEVLQAHQERHLGDLKKLSAAGRVDANDVVNAECALLDTRVRIVYAKHALRLVKGEDDPTAIPSQQEAVRCAETIVDLREKSMSDLKRLHGAGRVSDSVLAQAQEELLEARIRAARVRGRTK